MSRTVEATTFLIVSLVSSAAFAQKAERTIRGWTATGNDVVVQLVQRGEEMVDGVSQDYYFEALEIYSAKNGDILQRFKVGEAVGPAPPKYSDAKSEVLGAKFVETQGLVVPAPQRWRSPGGDFRLVSAATPWIEEQGSKYRCVVRHRIGLMDGSNRQVWTVVDHNLEGETSARRERASCPDVRVVPAWNPDGKRWAALVDGGESTTFHAGSTIELSAQPRATFELSEPLVADLSTDPQLKAGYVALSRGQFAEAKSAFEAVTLTEGRLSLALVEAFQGGKSAKKSADKAFKDSDKTGWDQALRAATYLVAGDSKRATKWIDKGIKDASSYDELLRMAALFELVDVAVANQLAVWALSHESAAAADASKGWNLLARGLLDANEFTKSKESLAKVGTKDRAFRITTARHAIDKGDAWLARDDVRALLEASFGDCAGLLLQGRLAARAGDNASAKQLFEGAAFCDPSLEEAVFFAADFARLAGDLAAAKKGFSDYLAASLPRRSDIVREARRAAAERWTKRLGHSGVVLTQSACSAAGDAFFCRGVAANTSGEAVEAEVAVKLKRKSLGAQKITIPPNETAPFGLRVESKTLKGATITIGRDRKESSLNETEIR